MVGSKFPLAAHRAQIEGQAHNLIRSRERFAEKITTQICQAWQDNWRGGRGRTTSKGETGEE